MCRIPLWLCMCEAQSTIHETIQQYTTSYNNALHISLNPSSSPASTLAHTCNPPPPPNTHTHTHTHMPHPPNILHRLYVRCVPVLILHRPGGDRSFTSPFVMLDLLLKGLFIRLNSGLTTLGYARQIGFPACHVSLIVTLLGGCLTLVWLNLKTSAS